jgi:hypothetical protein
MKNIEIRADRRPPEEAASENPKEQAEAILEDSEDRLKQGARTAQRQMKRERCSYSMDNHLKSG